MRIAVIAAAVAAMLLLIAAFATGFVFHAEPYGDLRNAWFAWHRTLGFAVPILALPVAIAGRRHGRRTAARALRGAAWLLVIGALATGWVAVSAWNDPGGSGTLVGGVRIPLLPGVSTALGNSGEQAHKLLATMLVWLLAAYVGRAVYRGWQRRVTRSGNAAALGPIA